MDEYNGNFRIATTKYDKNSNQISNVYVLDKDLKKLGETDDFAKGEDIHAVRFSGDTAYVITFEYTDPLFVIDLSNPKKPIIKGSVKISGFSTNLIPIDSDTLLGIGTANDFSNPYARGIKFALFDVSDPQKPTVLDKRLKILRARRTTPIKPFLLISQKIILQFLLSTSKLTTAV